ncbi:MAG: fructosamine kinase family protein [Alistipes sp.]|nr:fructosamine kinase family protein [Alistipes sp.]
MDKEITLRTILGEDITFMPQGSGLIETAGGKRYYLKTGAVSQAYRCEAHGLREMGKAAGVNVPQVIGFGKDFILTEYIPAGSPCPGFFTALGRMVASLHRVRGERFGFYEDNFIGANPQSNIPEGSVDWAEFYYRHRISFQVRLARRNGYNREFTDARTNKLRDNVYSMLSGVTEPPALLHGDLWADNFLCSTTGTPYLIDPAVYYGHREADIAMTMLFGGFPTEFYTAYDNELPLEKGWRDRIPVYQLYHVLNHLNLFGGGYLRQALSIIDSL